MRRMMILLVLVLTLVVVKNAESWIGNNCNSCEDCNSCCDGLSQASACKSACIDEYCVQDPGIRWCWAGYIPFPC